MPEEAEARVLRRSLPLLALVTVAAEEDFIERLSGLSPVVEEDEPEAGARVSETSSVFGKEKSFARPLLEETGTFVISTRSTTALFTTSSTVCLEVEERPFPVFCFRSMVRPDGMAGAASRALAAALRSMAV